jgi:L-rhamnose mutarotase
MKKVAFKMHLYEGFEDEYKKRHDEIPSELKSLLSAAGISDYSIFLDRSTGDLFAVMHVEDEERVQHLSSHPVMKKWWTFMKDIMDTNEDHSPISIPLAEVFHMK